MLKRALISVIFCLTSFSQLHADTNKFKWSSWSQQGFEVTKLDEQTLSIQGNITAGAYQAFKASFDGKIKTVHVSSGGGLVSEAVKIGLDLMKNGVDVVVDGPCLSSCANYFFLAGKHKVIEQNGFVAFHGSPWHGAILQYGAPSMNDFIDNGKIPPAMQKTIEESLKKYPNKSRAEMIGDFRSLLRDERDFFEKARVSDRLISNSLQGRFAETLPECQRFQPLSASEKDREPFLFISTKQMQAYGVQGVTGDQNWRLAFQLTQLTSTNKRDDGSPIFCLDAYDRSDWTNAISQLSPSSYSVESQSPVSAETVQ